MEFSSVMVHILSGSQKRKTVVYFLDSGMIADVTTASGRFTKAVKKAEDKSAIIIQSYGESQIGKSKCFSFITDNIGYDYFNPTIGAQMGKMIRFNDLCKMLRIEAEDESDPCLFFIDIEGTGKK